MKTFKDNEKNSFYISHFVIRTLSSTEQWSELKLKNLIVINEKLKWKILLKNSFWIKKQNI